MSGLYSVQGRWSVVRFVSMLAACGAISISGSARADCVFDKEGNLIWKNFLGGQTATVKCEPKPFKAATAEKPRDSFLISSLVEPLDTTDPLPIAASSLRIVVTDASGDEIEPAKAIKGLYAVRTYAVTSATEASARIEAAKKSVEPTAAHLESLRQCWGDWASGLTGTCNAAGLRSLHAMLLMEQRKHCSRPIGIEPKARCAWYVRALELTSEALKPGGSNQSLAPDAQCAALDALFQSSGKTTCALATDVTAIREMDKLMENPAAVPSGSYDVLVSKTEFVSGRDSEFFRTVDYEQSATLVNPSEGANSYVAITNFPHDLDATIALAFR